MTDEVFDALQTSDRAALEPHCTVDGLKRHAKLLRSKLDPDKTIKLSHAQTAVVRCIGRSANDVFSGREPSRPLFPAHVEQSERRDYQRHREIATLTEMFPDLELAAIIEFVSSWNLVHWREVASPSACDWSQPDVAPPFIDRLIGPALGTTASRVLPEDIDSEAMKLSRAAAPAPLEQFMPPSIDFASEKAVALAKIAGGRSLASAHYITTRIFGFDSWADLEASFRLASRSPFDEELGTGELSCRRKWQAELLGALLSTDRLSALELRSFWKPTSSSMLYASSFSWNPPADSSTSTIDTRNATRLSGKLSVKPRTGSSTNET
jgi:hypothetical protein